MLSSRRRGRQRLRVSFGVEFPVSNRGVIGELPCRMSGVLFPFCVMKRLAVQCLGG